MRFCLPLSVNSPERESVRCKFKDKTLESVQKLLHQRNQTNVTCWNWIQQRPTLVLLLQTRYKSRFGGKWFPKEWFCEPLATACAVCLPSKAPYEHIFLYNFARICLYFGQTLTTDLLVLALGDTAVSSIDKKRMISKRRHKRIPSNCCKWNTSRFK